MALFHMYSQGLIDWVILGAFYCAIALGFSLVWGIMNIINLAHGAFVIVGAYVGFTMYAHFHIDPFLGVLIAMATLFAVGWIVQYGVINRVIRAPLLVTFLLTFGLQLLIEDVLNSLFTGDTRGISTSYEGAGISIGTVHISLVRFADALVAIALTGALAVFLNRTRLGNAILATGMDRDAARLMGIDIAKIYALTFGIGAALAGAAGALLGQLQSFYPTYDGIWTVRSFVVVVLGGLGSPWYVLAGGLGFAFVETFVPIVFPQVGTGYENVFAFTVFVIVLLVRPTGLFGRAQYA